MARNRLQEASNSLKLVALSALIACLPLTESQAYTKIFVTFPSGHSNDSNGDVPKACNSAFIAAGDLPGAPLKSPGVAWTLTQVPPSSEQIEVITRNVLHKCIELERFNLNYRQRVARQGSLKGWRYFGSQEANSLVSLSGYITGTYERGKNFTTFKKLKRNVLENGNVLTFVGQTIGAAGSATEFGINAWHDQQARKEGYSPAAARMKVLNLRHEIDTLLDERARLVKTLADSNVNPRYVLVARAEEDVIRDMRDISLDEFVKFHSGARRLLAFQQSLYLLDIARNTTGAISSRFGWDALRNGNRHNNTTSGIFGSISGGLGVLTPVVSRGIGRAMGAYHQRYVNAVLQGTRSAGADNLDRDLDTLKSATSDQYLEHAELPLLRCALYSEHTKGVRKQLDLSSRQARAGLLAARENVAAGAITGGTRIAGSVLFLVAGIEYRRSSRHTNILLGAANICGTAGSAFAAADNIRIQLKRQRTNHKLAAQGLLPGQIIKERLKKLDEIETALNAPLKDRNRISSALVYDPAWLWNSSLAAAAPAADSVIEEPDMVH